MSTLVSGNMTLDPGQSRLFFPDFAAPDTNNGFAENMDGLHSDSVLGDLQYGDFRLQGWYGDRRKKFPTASFGSMFNDPADEIEDQRAYVDASFHRSLSADTGLDVRTFYDEYRYNGSGA
jgi:iron complex outermembrane recepter protein